ncbi:hypothetical protein C0995_004743, partial [Termitomyces sp. Mi166
MPGQLSSLKKLMEISRGQKSIVCRILEALQGKELSEDCYCLLPGQTMEGVDLPPSMDQVEDHLHQVVASLILETLDSGQKMTTHMEEKTQDNCLKNLIDLQGGI